MPKLVAWFKKRSNIAIATIVQEKYTMIDAQNKREPYEYARVIICAAKSAKIGSMGHIIMLIYNGLELEFKQDLTMRSLSTLLEQFLQKLDNWKDIWWELASQTGRMGRLYTNPYQVATGYMRNSRNPYQANLNYNRSQYYFNSYVNHTSDCEGDR